jgi:ABC-type uncharacterized transport system fused permease/ATPase subunit
MKNESLLKIIYFSDSIQVNIIRNYFILLVIVCLCYELIGILIMYITSSLYQCVNDNNWKLFRRNLLISFLCILLQAFLSSFKYYLRDRCGLVMREVIVLACNNRLHSMTNDRSYLFSNLIQLTSSSASSLPPSLISEQLSLCSSFSRCFSVFTSSSVNSSNNIFSKETENSSLTTATTASASLGTISNIDQRIINDVNDFIDNFLKILEKVLILPFLFLFYICYLCYYISWFSPILCFCYFFLSGCLCHFFTISLIPLKISQSSFEGNFHFFVINFLISFENILLCFGGTLEKQRLKALFDDVLKNKRKIILKEWILNYCIFLFDYGSTTICYMIVGISLFLSASSSSSSSASASSSASSISSSQRILLWSRGIYASLALINGLSLIIDSLQWYSLMKASQQRIEEFFSKTAHSLASTETSKQQKDEKKQQSSSSLSSSLSSIFSSRNDGHAYIQLKNLSDHEKKVPLSSNNRNDLEEQLLSSSLNSNIMKEERPTDGSPNQSSDMKEDDEDEALFCSICQHQPFHSHHHTRSSMSFSSSSSSSSSTSSCFIESSFHLDFPIFDLFSKDKKKLLIKSLHFPSLSSSQKPYRLLITGATGCGKSTLLKTISTKILEDISNLTTKKSITMKMMKRKIMYCPQQPYFLLKVSEALYC